MAATTAAPQVNGVGPQSAFIDHLLQYPFVTDGVSTVKQNKYGQQTLALSSTAYEKVAKPVLPYVSPYLAKPYEYVSPYVKKADEIGDRTLSTIDQRFPAVRKPTAEFYQDTKDLALFPVRQGFASRDHVYQVFTDERKQVQGEGVLPLSKALVSTAVIVSNETVSLVRKTIDTLKAQAPTAAPAAATPAPAAEKTTNGTN